MHRASFSSFVKPRASASPLKKGVVTALILLTLSLAPLSPLAPLAPLPHSGFTALLSAPQAHAAVTQNTTLTMPGNSMGMVGHWTFDGKDMTQNVADTSGAGNNGALNGATTTAPGVLGQALKFDGTSQYVNIPDGSAYAFADTTFSLAFWLKTSASTGGEAIMAKDGTSSGVGWGVRLKDNCAAGQLEALTKGTGGTFAYAQCSAATVNDNNWHHVAIIYTTSTSAHSGNSISVYVDGSLSNGTNPASSNTYAAPSLSFTIGSRQGSNDFPGSIDDVRIYNRALTQAEVTQLYNQGVGTHTNKNVRATQVIFLTTTGSHTFNVPSDWNNSNNTIEVIGGGGGGSGSTDKGTGGGGGGYSKIVNLSLTGGGTVTYFVGYGGQGGSNAAGITASSTWFCNSTSNCATISGTAVVVGATGGGGGDTAAPSVGGKAGGGGPVFVASTTYSGGAGGVNPNNSAGYSGGGGAGGPSGTGSAGGLGVTGGGGSGGGGNGGGSSTVGSSPTGPDGAQGGTATDGTAGGAGAVANVSPAGDGSHGSGGGGGANGEINGGNGGAGIEWDSTHGSGGGGGGTGDKNNPVGGVGGNYGGGGGGSRTPGGAGAQGIVVITYTPASKVFFINTTLTPPNLRNGLIGHWTFDGKDMLKNVADTSGQGNTGYMVAAATSSQQVAGQIGQALKFNGTTQYVSVADSSSLQLGTPLTLSLWFKTSASTAGGAATGLIRKDTLSGTRYLYGLAIASTWCNGGGSDRLCAQYYNGTNYTVGNGSAVNDGKWHHATMTISGTTISLYYDGVFKGQTTISGTQGVPTGELDIGADPPCCVSSPRGDYLPGTIDDVRVYNRTLSQAEITQLYNLGH